jgi:hypothetical protein
VIEFSSSSVKPSSGMARSLLRVMQVTDRDADASTLRASLKSPWPRRGSAPRRGPLRCAQLARTPRTYELTVNLWVKIATIPYTSLPNRPTVERSRGGDQSWRSRVTVQRLG